MAKRKKKQYVESQLSEELLALIRVTPEMTENALAKLKYTIHEPPENGKIPRGKYWCSYCNSYKKFTNKRGSELTYPRCETCNISLEDFYIKTHNKLWQIKK
jgi:hypothetical protein